MNYLERAVADGGSGNSSVVVDLETAFAAFTDAQFALCMASGTSALVAACRAAGVRPGDLVGVSALGPVMSGQAILALGARPVFLDCASESSFGISATSAAEAIERGIKAVIVVPMWGYWDEQPAVLGLLRRNGVPVIADAAQAPFLRLRAGLLNSADIVCLSLHARKPLRAGEGGVCLTNNRQYAERIVSVRNFGQQAKIQEGHLVPAGPFGVNCGVNMKMNALGAAWCLSQMDDLSGIRTRLDLLRGCALDAFGASGAAWREASVAATVLQHGRYGIVAICADQHNAEHLTSALAGQGIEADTKRFAYRPMYTAACFGSADELCPSAEQLTQVTVACRLEEFARFLPD
jgi:perosamine synthetase